MLDQCGGQQVASTGSRAVNGEGLANATWNVATFPRRNTGNPYMELFYRALEPYGVQHVGGFECSLQWLNANRDRVNALHFHWPERLWRGRPKGRLDGGLRLALAAAPRSVRRLRQFLTAAGELGIKRIWTVHNLEHHEGAGRVDRSGYRALTEWCDLLVTHSGWAASEVRKVFPKSGNVVPIHHGVFTDAYPVPLSRDKVLRRIGLTSAKPVIACVGALRRYKGIELACEAAKRLGDSVQLIVAGGSRSATDRAYWREHVGRVPGAVLIDRVLDDQEFADVMAASDVILQSYSKITGSGLLFAAWTFGRGVVASDLPFFREMLDDHPDAGRLFHTGDADDLARAIEDYLAIPESVRRSAVAAAAEAHSWEKCIQPVADVFSQWREAKQPTDF